MAITHTTAVRTAIATAVKDALDAGTAPHIIFYAGGTPSGGTVSGGTVIARIPLDTTSVGTVSNGVLTFDLSPVPEDSGADASGTINSFVARTQDIGSGVDVIAGTVTATGGGGDITMPSVAATAGVPVRLTSFTYTAPA